MSALKSNIKVLLENQILPEERLVKSTGLSPAELLELLDAGKVELRTIEQIAKELRVPVYGLLQFNSTETSPVSPDEISRLRDENERLHSRLNKLEQILIEEGMLKQIPKHEAE
jgi:DNA-binding Xre family transcriptional regulator